MQLVRGERLRQSNDTEHHLAAPPLARLAFVHLFLACWLAI